MANEVGQLLRRWRQSRRLTQLELALQTDVSARHLCFLETGRAVPSREILLRLARVLDLPLRDRNAMLRAAGQPVAWHETPLEAPEMEGSRTALTSILAYQAPFASVVIDRGWDLVMVNAPFAAFIAGLPGGRVRLRSLEVLAPPRLNLLELFLRPDGLRALIKNWAEIAPTVLARAEREAMANRDGALQKRLKAVERYPDVAAMKQALETTQPREYFVPMELLSPRGPIRLIGTISTLGTALDITLRELRIETYLPADPASERLLRRTGRRVHYR